MSATVTSPESLSLPTFLWRELTTTCWQVLHTLWRRWQALVVPYLCQTGKVDNEVPPSIIKEKVLQLFQPASDTEDSKILLKGPRSCQACIMQYHSAEKSAVH